LLVSLGEFSGYFVQEWPDLVFWERHDPGDNPARSLGILVAERAQKNAGLVRSEDRGRALDANRGGVHGLVIPEKRDRRPRLLLGGDRFLKTRQHILRQAHLPQRKQEGQG
jgi:hypothetical protein